MYLLAVKTMVLWRFPTHSVFFPQPQYTAHKRVHLDLSTRNFTIESNFHFKYNELWSSDTRAKAISLAKSRQNGFCTQFPSVK